MNHVTENLSSTLAQLLILGSSDVQGLDLQLSLAGLTFNV